jgi:hypothetical protein
MNDLVTEYDNVYRVCAVLEVKFDQVASIKSKSLLRSGRVDQVKVCTIDQVESIKSKSVL